jgi:hypothetical protein
MIQGWVNDDYFMLFEEQAETVSRTEQYGLSEFLPGYTVQGLKGWDDFILKDRTGAYHTVPTVPITPKHVSEFTFSIDLSSLRPDERVRDRIKWYVTPLIFGGSPETPENMTWLSFEQHVEAVKWWNRKYREIST